jgi:hypothetical protein
MLHDLLHAGACNAACALILQEVNLATQCGGPCMSQLTSCML